MNASLIRLFALLALSFAVSGAITGLEPHPLDDASVGTVRFGTDGWSIAAQARGGFAPDLATVWIGPWTLEHGWQDTGRLLEDLVARDVVPVVQFYYWGDDMSVTCLEDGCQSEVHDVRKTTAGWQRLADELVAHLAAHAGDRPVIIVLETEFNRGAVAGYEPLDLLLAEKASFLKRSYPPAQVVLGFGNWYRDGWDTWDRAAAASDAIGFQTLRGSTRDGPARYADAANATLHAAERIKDLFDRPVVLHDLGLSSHPEPEYVLAQARTMDAIFARLPELKGAGVEAILYRSWRDDPTFDTANYFGRAERHWGLAWSGTGALKPAAEVWLAGVAIERGLPGPAMPSLVSTPVGTEGVSLPVGTFLVRPNGTWAEDPDAATGTWHLRQGYVAQPLRFTPGVYELAVHARAARPLGADGGFEVVWNDDVVMQARPTVADDVHSATLTLAGEGLLALRVKDRGAAPAGPAGIHFDTVAFRWTEAVPRASFDAQLDGRRIVVAAAHADGIDADLTTYRWSFGDGTEATGPRVAHTFEESGAYVVTLTVSAGNMSAVSSRTVEATDDTSGPQWWHAAAVGGLVLLVAAGALVVARRGRT